MIDGHLHFNVHDDMMQLIHNTFSLIPNTAGMFNSVLKWITLNEFNKSRILIYINYCATSN
jgi:hypothetical protein